MSKKNKTDKIDTIKFDFESDNIKQKTSKSDKKANKKIAKKSGRGKGLIYNICIVILFLIFAGCAIYLIKYFYESKKSEDRFDDLKTLIDTDVVDDEGQKEIVYIGTDTGSDKKEEFVSIDGKLVLKKLANLYSKNNDFMGWITIPGADIDYPVMQTIDDEEYYIYRDFDKEYSSSGTLFIDSCSDVGRPSDVILIYGHNMKAGTMFHNLTKYDDEEFYKEHKLIQFDTIYGSGTYEIIAAFKDKIYPEDYTGIKYYDFFDASSEEEFDAYIAYCKSKTPYDTDASAEYGDKLICLSTCAYHINDGRFAVVAKKIE